MEQQKLLVSGERWLAKYRFANYLIDLEDILVDYKKRESLQRKRVEICRNSSEKNLLERELNSLQASLDYYQYECVMYFAQMRNFLTEQDIPFEHTEEMVRGLLRTNDDLAKDILTRTNKLDLTLEEVELCIKDQLKGEIKAVAWKDDEKLFWSGEQAQVRLNRAQQKILNSCISKALDLRSIEEYEAEELDGLDKKMGEPTKCPRRKLDDVEKQKADLKADCRIDSRRIFKSLTAQARHAYVSGVPYEKLAEGVIPHIGIEPFNTIFPVEAIRPRLENQ